MAKRLLASAKDVESALLRPLSEPELQHVESLLGRAERVLRNVVRRYDVPFGSLDKDAVIDVLAEMVARRLRNPDGVITEGDGDYSYRFDRGVASGRLSVLDDDLLTLGIDTSDGFWVWNPRYE